MYAYIHQVSREASGGFLNGVERTFVRAFARCEVPLFVDDKIAVAAKPGEFLRVGRAFHDRAVLESRAV